MDLFIEIGGTARAMGKLTLKQWTTSEGLRRESWALTVDALHSSRTVRPDLLPELLTALHAAEAEAKAAGLLK